MSPQVWSLGNTTVRNPNRLLPGLRILKKYFANGPSFSGNQEIQGEFFKKLLTHTESAEKFVPGETRDDPIYTYIAESSPELPDDDYQQKNGRLWLSPLDDFGFIDAYHSDKTKIKNPGKAILEFNELEKLIWLKQLLKFQYPNHKSKIKGGGNLRPVVLLFKLMLRLNGLSTFEITLTILSRYEDIEKNAKKIKKYRKRRNECSSIKELKDSIKNESILEYFEEDLKSRIETIKEVKNRYEIGMLPERMIEEKLNPAVGLGKGPNTKRAKHYKKRLKEKITEGKDIKSLRETLEEYFLLVKGDTLIKDYPDLTKRYINMTGVIQIFKSDDGVHRWKIHPDYEGMIKYALENQREIFNFDDENYQEYKEYLWNIKKPELPIDNSEIIEKRISKFKKEAKNQEYIDVDTNIETSFVDENLILHERYRRAYERVKERRKIDNWNLKDIKNEIEDLYHNYRKFEPREVEFNIWKSLIKVLNVEGLISETRNFNVDTELNPLFTAAGFQPDMAFPLYKDYLVVEVTISKGKTQARAEKEPVTRHVAMETHKNPDKNVFSIFLAPSIHEETFMEFYRRTLGDPVIIDTEGTEKNIDIIPLTFGQYFSLYQYICEETNPNKEIISIIKSFKGFASECDNHEEWKEKIDSKIGDF